MLRTWSKPFFESVTKEEPVLRVVNAKTGSNVLGLVIPFPDNPWKLKGQMPSEGSARQLRMCLRAFLDRHIEDGKLPDRSLFQLPGRAVYEDAKSIVDHEGQAHTLHDDLQDWWYAEAVRFLKRCGTGSSYPAHLARCTGCGIYFLNPGGKRQRTCGKRACANRRYHREKGPRALRKARSEQA
jgi:hypothetical protein